MRVYGDSTPPLWAAFFMAQAARDQNRVPTMIAVSNADMTTPIALYVNPVTHQLMVTLTAPVVTAKSDAARDQNNVPTLLAVSESDGVTPVALVANPTNHKLVVETT